jgi:hypothetical protein
VLKIRLSDGTEKTYDSKMFDFRVMSAKLQIIYRNTSAVFKEYENGVWALAHNTGTTAPALPRR